MIAASVRQLAAPAKHNAASPTGAPRWRFASTPYVVSALALAAILTAWLASRSIGPSDITRLSGGQWRTSELTPAARRSADAPAPLPIDTIVKTRLRPDEAAYFQLPEPVEEFNIVVDLRLVDNVRSHLGATVSVLDPNGAIIRDSLVWIGGTAYGRTARQTASYGARSLRKSARFAVSEAGAVVFSMINTVDAVDYIFRVPPADSGAP